VFRGVCGRTGMSGAAAAIGRVKGLGKWERRGNEYFK